MTNAFILINKITKEMNFSPTEVFVPCAEQVGKRRDYRSLQQLLQLIRENGYTDSKLHDDIIESCVRQSGSDVEQSREQDTLIQMIKNDDTRINVYIAVGKLRAAYLIAIRLGKEDKVRLIRDDAQKSGQTAVYDIYFGSFVFQMLADFLEKNDIKAFNQSINSDQIDLLKDNLQQEIDDNKNQIHQLYISKTQDINKINSQTSKLIEQCEQLEVKRKELIIQIEDYSKLESHARHVNSNYHQVHRLNRFINGIKQLIQLHDHIHECRQLCKKGSLNEAKNLYQTVENLINNEYLFPHTKDKFYQQHYPLYETFQKYVRQLRTDICQTHHILWNDGVDRTTKNQLKLNLNHLDQLFKCIFYEEKGEKLLMEKNIQTSIESIPLMTIISSTIANDFIECIRERLLNIIPNDFQYVEIFRSLLQTVMDFEKYLTEINFFSDNQISNIISSVVGNIDESIIKSRCRTYLFRSRQLLQSNAIITTSLKTIEIGDDEQLFKQNEQDKEKYKNETFTNILSSTISLDELDANMFRFPRTIIVEHVYEYMEFIRTVLKEADQLENYGAHLCATVRNMMELFHVIYANLHEKKAQEFPYLTGKDLSK
ncbi:unnamed protein product [Rotaria sp. Silwood2]|nr:unnamed protein product [Rotaria sp. Silwood2]